MLLRQLILDQYQFPKINFIEYLFIFFSKKKINRIFFNFNQRDPLTVRQEVQPFDDLIPETSLADVQLSEMPGLQNTGRFSFLM
jgi:hypothetical protein